MKLNIRPEITTDYAGIAELTFAAFNRAPFVDEALLVDVLRHRREYDPSWSLVAEIDDKIVGHAMFHRYLVGFQGQLVEAALLAPLTVHPDFQRQGIGGALMEAGHSRLREQNIPFAFLVGHASYYPRFGYETRLFGINQLKMDVALPESSADYVLRVVGQAEVEELIRLWRTTFSASDFAMFPGHSVLDWVPHGVNKVSEVLIEDGRVSGYVRYDTASPQSPKLFMAKNAEAALALVGALRRKIGNSGPVAFTLPLPPVFQKWFPWAEVLTEGWEAGMVKILDQKNDVISGYCREVKAGTRQPGAPVWPPHFELS